MEKLKFRAWNKSSKCMHLNVGVHPDLMMDLAGDDEYYLTHEDGRYLIGLGFDNYITMQYSPQNDVAETRICEGDVLSDFWRCEVYKDENTGAYMVKYHTNPTVNKPQTLYTYLKNRAAAGCKDTDNLIIGNIYENPDLIK